MKRTLLSLVGMACILGFSAVAGDWETDLGKASAKAAKEGKFMLVDFTGSDWCGWCIKLDKEVFSKSEFKKYAKENLVLVLLDFPRKSKLPVKEAAANKALAKKYSIEGFPTVLLLLPDGTEVARTGYQEGGPEKYVAHLKTLLSPHQDQLPKPTGASRTSTKSPRPAPAGR